MDDETFYKLKAKFPKKLGRAKTVKLYCKEDCCAGDNESWRYCSVKGCFLWSFRLGREILGTRTSFDKQTAKLAVLRKKELSGKRVEVSKESSEVQESASNQQEIIAP